MSRYDDYKSLILACHRGLCDKGELVESIACMNLSADEVRDFHIAFQDEVNELKARFKIEGGV